MSLSFEVYAEHVGLHAPPTFEHSHDLLLAAACAAADPAALAEFEREILPRSRGPIARLKADDAFVDEVLQQTRTKLLVADGATPPRVSTYGGRGSLAAWVTVTAMRTGLSLLRRGASDASREHEAWEQVVALVPAADPESASLKHQHRETVRDAIVQACGSLPSRDRAVLRMHFVDGLSLQEIARIYAVHRATMTRWISATRATLANSVRELLAERLDLPTSELDAMNRVVRSQLELSLSQLFVTPQTGDAAGSPQ